MTTNQRTITVTCLGMFATVAVIIGIDQMLQHQQEVLWEPFHTCMANERKVDPDVNVSDAVHRCHIFSPN